MLVATKHLARANGQFLAMKGVYPKEEIQEITNDFNVLAVHDLKIQGLDAERCLVCIGYPGYKE